MRFGVSKAVYNTSASSTAFSIKILRFPPVRSYAESKPPRWRIVVSNRLIWQPSVPVKSILASSSSARSNSSYSSMIMRVSRLSTNVAAQPQNVFLYPPRTGLNSSCAHASFLYPFQACKNVSRTSLRRFSLCAFSMGLSGTGLCWILGIFEARRRGRRSILSTGYSSGRIG
jgi:hypothetical protein